MPQVCIVNQSEWLEHLNLNCLTLNFIIMSKLENRVQLIGNLGAAPEIVNLESGKKIAKFSLATNDRYKNKQGETITDTQWHNVVAWNGTAGIIENYVEKGNRIGVVGKLTHRKYQDKDGNDRYITEVVCDELMLMDK
jgi:single-strand DNA-binding protein